MVEAGIKGMSVGLVIASFLVLLVAWLHERSVAGDMVDKLAGMHSPQAWTQKVSFQELDRLELPLPVARYFRYALRDGQPVIQRAIVWQKGMLRTGDDAQHWSAFRARQYIMPLVPGFVWNARVSMMAPIHVRVLDSYMRGSGAGRVSLMTLLPLSRQSDVPELNSAALMRYLAEAVWYPTALLPQAGVHWEAVSAQSARASLDDAGNNVSLVFHFGDEGGVQAIYSEGRYAKTNDGYRLKPWEGRFRDYQPRNGMRVPGYGEVGWYEGEQLIWAWRGEVTNIDYEFAATPVAVVGR